MSIYQSKEFNLEEIPVGKWRDRFYEFHVWLSATWIETGHSLSEVYGKISRTTSSILVESWIISLNMMMKQMSADDFIGGLYREFLGEWIDYQTQVRQEYLLQNQQSRKALVDTVLGLLFLTILKKSDALCNQMGFLQWLDRLRFGKVCSESDLQIKCPKKHDDRSKHEENGRSKHKFKSGKFCRPK
ncbi:unnamed protein product [Dovyalis caffra]|uniref:Uncharacterized protein n=1 Tax=Dovyalis caffra TaxID=77055 RepID=A0AAV1RF96_9ROSI|nr:unnamed protein product [Dovyalis caffra]